MCLCTRYWSMLSSPCGSQSSSLLIALHFTILQPRSQLTVNALPYFREYIRYNASLKHPQLNFKWQETSNIQSTNPSYWFDKQQQTPIIKIINADLAYSTNMYTNIKNKLLTCNAIRCMNSDSFQDFVNSPDDSLI
jgi:hypothetical protein